MTVHITASAIERVEACPASASLPRSESVRADSTAGIAKHAELAANTAPGERAEIAFALNVRTGEGRELAPQSHRAYPDLGPDWIFGTADVVRLGPESVAIADHKTGGGGRANTTPAAKNLQLGMLAVAAASAHGRDRAVVELRFHDDFPDDVASLDVLDLAATMDRIRRAHARAIAPDPAIVMGEHCRYCPCLPRCPAQTTLVRELAGGALAKVPTLELTPAAAAEAWRRLREAKRVLGVIEGALKAYASLGDVPLGDGKVLGERQASRDSIDGAIAVRVLRTKFGVTTEAIDIAAEPSVTKASLTRMVKADTGPGTVAAKLREVLATIAAEGGVTTTWSRKVDEHTEGEE